MSNVPERITKCPILPECVTKVLFKDSDGNILRFDAKKQEFRPHVCSTKGASQFPSIAYGAKWYNKETQRFRYKGPERMRSTVETPPYDERFRKRGADANEVWEHKQTYIAHLVWEPVED